MSHKAESRKVFLIPVNAAVEGEATHTVMRVDCGNVTMRTAKRKLRIVFNEWGIPARFQKIFIKELCNG